MRDRSFASKAKRFFAVRYSLADGRRKSTASRC
jgi:hypothetical protein